MGGLSGGWGGGEISWPEGTGPDDRIDNLSVERIYAVCLAIDLIKSELG